MSSGHADQVMQSLLQYQKTGYLCDTVIVTDDGQVRTHAAVLAAVSPVLKAALTPHRTSEQHTIVLSGVDVCTVDTILTIIYTGDAGGFNKCPADNSDNSKLAEISSVIEQLRLQVSTADIRTREQSADSDTSECIIADNVLERTWNGASETDNRVRLTQTDNVCNSLVIALDSAAASKQHVAMEQRTESRTRNETLSQLKANQKRDVLSRNGRCAAAVSPGHSTTPQGGQNCLAAVNTPPAVDTDWIQARLSRRGRSNKHPSCWICGRVCSSLAVLRDHVTIKHASEDRNVLEDAKLLRARAFLREIRPVGTDLTRKRQRKRLLCEHCGKVCRSPVKLAEHSLVHSGSLQKVECRSNVTEKSEETGNHHLCEVCGTVCSTSSALKSHHRLHISSGALSCRDCGQTFTLRKNLVRHELRRHRPSPQLMCEDCGRTFLHLASLRDHKARQHPSTTAESLYFACKRCKQRFSHISYLRHHILDVHRPAKPRERSLCTLCGRSFATKFTLAMHMRLHSGEKPHQCSQCSSRFPTRAALRQHSYKHTDNYRHVCCVCGKRFTTPSALAGHERVHTGEKPFTCDQCNRAFAQRCQLKQHVILMHTRQRLFRCALCNATFCRQVDLKRHSNRTHREVDRCSETEKLKL